MVEITCNFLVMVDPEWVKQKYQEEGVEIKDSDDEWEV
jgi:hypothetical protein